MATIYLIDDDFASELLLNNLSDRGHDVVRFSSADEALAAITDIVQGDLVILDLIMPQAATDVDGNRAAGMRVYREIRKRRPELPILVFTANQDSAVADAIHSDPQARLISRWASPTFREFISTIHEMLGIPSKEPQPRPFIVHGHDDATKLEVKNYLQNTLGLSEPVVLHEQPNRGRTIIEKFEYYAAAAQMAFVLLTPDDHVASAGDTDSEKYRARQNVIFELGFFLGAMGRHSGRVFLLHKGPIELPSDLAGVIYVDITGGLAGASDQIRRELAALQE